MLAEIAESQPCLVKVCAPKHGAGQHLCCPALQLPPMLTCVTLTSIHSASGAADPGCTG